MEQILLERPTNFLIRQEPTLQQTRSVHFKKELADFSGWWQENQDQFDNLSFRLDNQTNLFLQTLKQSGFNEAFSQTRADLYGYYFEYIRQEAILPLSYYFADFNGENKLMSDFYGQKPVIDTIDNQEREGSLKKGIIDLEKRLLKLREGESVFRVSPAGWTGLGYEYSETQAQIFWRDQEKIRGLTIRLRTDLESILNFFDELGIKRPEGLSSEKELIKWLVEQNITLPYSIDQIFLWVINYLSDNDHQGRDLKEQFINWQKKDQTFFHYDEVADLINFLEDYFRDLINRDDNELIRSELKKSLAFVLMAMAGAEINKQEIGEVDLVASELFGQDVKVLPDVFFQQVFDRLQSLPGCAGSGLTSGFTGGFTENYIMTAFGPMEIVGDSKDLNTLKCVTCPFCQQLVDAEIISKNGKKVIHCPNCGAEADR